MRKKRRVPDKRILVALNKTAGRLLELIEKGRRYETEHGCKRWERRAERR